MNIGEIRKHIVSREPVLIRIVDGAHIYYQKCEYIYGIHFHGDRKGKIHIGVECADKIMFSGEPKSIISVSPKDVFPCPRDERDVEEGGKESGN